MSQLLLQQKWPCSQERPGEQTTFFSGCVHQITSKVFVGLILRCHAKLPSALNCPGRARSGRGPGADLFGFKLVAQTPHGQDQSRVWWVDLNFGAQTLHVDVQGLGVTDVVRAPHLLVFLYTVQ